jgi:hypothetical protein
LVEECEKFGFTKLEDDVHIIMSIEKCVPDAKYLFIILVLLHPFEKNQIILQGTKIGNSGFKKLMSSPNIMNSFDKPAEYGARTAPTPPFTFPISGLARLNSDSESV